MLWKALALTGLTAALGAVVVHHRGKAKVNDVVKFWYKPVIPGVNLGDQAIELIGRVVAKRDPIYGPFYDVQLFSKPKNIAIPELMAVLNALPSTIESVKDKDIIQNLGDKVMMTPSAA